MESVSREALGVPTRRAALHVDDLSATEGDHLVALVSSSFGIGPPGRADDLVIADLGELRLHLDPSRAPFLDLELQDLTGLVRAVSRGCVFPPQMAVGDAAPFCVSGEQERERCRIAAIESFGRSAKLIDHRSSIAGSAEPT